MIHYWLLDVIIGLLYELLGYLIFDIYIYLDAFGVIISPFIWAKPLVLLSLAFHRTHNLQEPSGVALAPDICNL